MKECLNCKRSGLPDELHFCPSCGADLDAQTALAQKNRKTASIGAAAEEKAVVESAVNEPKTQQPTPEAEVNKKTKPKRRGRLRVRVRLIGAVLGCVLCIAAAIAVLFAVSNASKTEPILYVRDGVLYTVNAKGKNEQMLRSVSFENSSEYRAVFAEKAAERFVFVTGMTEEGVPCGIAYADLSDKDMPVRTLDESVELCEYGISKDGKTVWYVSTAGDIWVHDLQNARKVASNAVEWLIADDLSRCAYVTAEQSLYAAVMKNEAPPILLASGPVQLELVKENVLAYDRLNEAGETELVLYDFKRLQETSYPNAHIVADKAKDGGFYFMLCGGDSPIIDTLAQSDAAWAVKNGNKSEQGYPAGEWYYWYNVYTEQGTEQVRGDISMMNREEYLLYSARQALRVRAEGWISSIGALYYHNGNKATLVDENVMTPAFAYAERTEDTPLLYARLAKGGQKIDIEQLAQQFAGTVKAIEYIEADGSTRIETSVIGSAEDTLAMQRELQKLMNAQLEYCTAEKAKTNAVGVSGSVLTDQIGGPMYTAQTAVKEDTMYAIVWDYNSLAYDLYEKAFGKEAELTKLADDVTNHWAYEWGVVSAATDNEYPELCTLYADSAKVDAEVLLSSVVSSKEEATLYYLKASESGKYALCRYENGKTQPLCENVFDFAVLSNGNALVLRGYDDENGVGELCIVKAKREPITLSAEVSTILDPMAGLKFDCMAEFDA